MNTHQLKRALEHNSFTKKTFCGVFAADEIPKIIDTFPCGFVANTDPSTEPGTLGWLFTFPRVKKENFSIVTDIPLNMDLNSTKSKHGTNVKYKVRGVKCVDNTVFFTFIIKVVVIA